MAETCATELPQPGALVTIAIGRGLCQGELIELPRHGIAAISGPEGPMMGHLVTPWRPQTAAAQRAQA
jgi:hypothetical protein